MSAYLHDGFLTLREVSRYTHTHTDISTHAHVHVGARVWVCARTQTKKQAHEDTNETNEMLGMENKTKDNTNKYIHTLDSSSFTTLPTARPLLYSISASSHSLSALATCARILSCRSRVHCGETDQLDQSRRCQGHDATVNLSSTRVHCGASKDQLHPLDQGPKDAGGQK